MLLVGLLWTSTLWFEILIYKPTVSLLSTVVGLAMTVLGLLLIISSRIKLKGMGRTATPKTKLVTTGPYAITRHPWYWGWTLDLIGCSILIKGKFSLLLAFLFFSIAIYRAFEEEKELRKTYRDEWKEYCNKVGFFFKFKKEKPNESKSA
jgi:protein-S-isoprenylcysteine O-methyltransferase Ste14